MASGKVMTPDRSSRLMLGLLVLSALAVFGWLVANLAATALN